MEKIEKEIKKWKLYFKILCTIFAVSLTLLAETYCIEAINQKDDLICMAGILLSAGVILLLTFALIKIWYNGKQ